MRALRLMAALLACALCMGCGAASEAPMADTAPVISAAPAAIPAATETPREALLQEAVERLSLRELPEERVLLLSAGEISDSVQFPALSGELSREQLIFAVETLFERVDFDPATLELSCCLTFESDLLLSALLEAKDASGAVALQPITVERATGRILRLSDLLSAEDRGWRGLMADLVAEAADRGELPLLNEVPPVRDDQLFYLIGEGQIVLLYRPYEITTYQAGYPCFVLPMESLAGYLSAEWGLGGESELTEMKKNEVMEP